jgi:hypothetical protein
MGGTRPRTTSCVADVKPSLHDRRGRPVRVGARVRVLSVPASLMKSLPPEEQVRVSSMVGEVFEVYEIEGDAAWVEKVWRSSDGAESHALALAADEMELV